MLLLEYCKVFSSSKDRFTNNIADLPTHVSICKDDYLSTICLELFLLFISCSFTITFDVLALFYSSFRCFSFF